MRIVRHICVSLAALFGLGLCLPTGLFAQEQQQPLTPEQEEKQFYEAVEQQLEKYTEALDLADWQIFYMDSILVADFKGMRDELKGMGEAKVGNSDLYIIVQDKWAEKTYNAVHRILNDEQWNKYLKMGAARGKKSRDKRAQKREEKK